RLHPVEALHAVGAPGGCRQGPREQSLGERAVQPSAPAILTAGVAGSIMKATIDALRGWLDRVLSIGYGVGYDYVYPRLRYYPRLQAEVRRLLEAAVPAPDGPRRARVLG